MKRVRLYELSKELRLETRQVVADARRLGAMVSSPSSSVDEKTADRIRELYYPKKPAATEHRAARLVKVHKPAAPPVEATESPAAERKPEDQAVQIPAHSAPEAAAEPQAGAAGRMRIIKLTPKPAPVKPAPSTRPPAQPPTQATQAPRSTSHAAPPAEVAAPATETPARSRRTTYIPPRATRPIGRHGKGAHKKAGRFNDGPQARAFTAERSVMAAHRAARAVPAVFRPVRLMEGATVREFAERLDIKPKDVVASLLQHGVMATINQPLDASVALDVGRRFGYEVSFGSFEDLTVESEFDVAPEMMEDTERRAPVVTVMGHVDHGKTSLLDAIRSSSVAEGEAGGITQHIGAYSVEAPNPDSPSETRRVVFLDTPGHEAFTMMRARGARVTDVVVLVVAADDGVMPQTVEAIHHAKAAKVPMIVAINKIDKPDAKPERVRAELLQHEVQVESLGGDVLDVEVSATKKLNLDRLVETIGLQAEILELKANPNRAAEGTVIEAKLDRGRGPVATVLVQRGTLHVGDIIVAGAEWGRVRALVSDTGAAVADAGPSTPVEVLGFNGTPEAGDRLAVVASEARAREITDYRARQKREKAEARGGAMRGSLEQMMSQLKSAGRKEFPLVIKGDVQGSVEAIIGALDKLGTEEVAARVIHAGVGGINESDVRLAETSNGAIIAFNVRANKEAQEAAERAGIEIRYYNIIYDLVDDVKKAMSGLLAPTLRETVLGNAIILEIFNVSKVGKVAGCRVTDGVVERGANVRLIRDNVVIHEGKLSQLKRFKDDAREVSAGQECGMAFESYQDMRQGDTIECYRVEKVQRSL